jgi:hypothetical protein
MTASHQLVYFIFAIVLVFALILDLGLLSKKDKTIMEWKISKMKKGDI